VKRERRSIDQENQVGTCTNSPVSAPSFGKVTEQPTMGVANQVVIIAFLSSLPGAHLAAIASIRD